MSDSCSGDCCRYFTIGTPQEVMERMERENSSPDTPKGTLEENRILKDMLLYRGMLRWNPAGASACTIKRLKAEGPTPWNVFHAWTCKHLQEQPDGSGRCGIYETRPYMCRAYPNGKTCEFSSCTWDKWKPRVNAEKLIPARALVEPRTVSTVLGRAVEIGKEPSYGPVTIMGDLLDREVEVR